MDRQWAIGDRFGLLVIPSTLLYASAGYTRADLTISGGEFAQGDKELNGFFVGLGGEQASTRNASLRLEYRFSDCADVGDAAFEDLTIENVVHSVRLGMNWKFSSN